MTDIGSHPGPGPATPADAPPALEVIPEGEGPAEYTFVPRSADAAERATTWVTASADDVLDLERWR